jgi:hypothetical protein
METAVRTNMVIKANIRPYSTALVPDSSRKNLVTLSMARPPYRVQAPGGLD